MATVEIRKLVKSGNSVVVALPKDWLTWAVKCQRNCQRSVMKLNRS